MNQQISGQLRLGTEGQFSLEAEQFAVIEACLFAAGHPLTYDKLGAALGISGDCCRELVERFASVYNNDTPFPRGILLVRFPDSCQLCTKEQYGEEIKTALGIRRGGNLSQSLLEVLAIIAYNQPATRTFVDTVRGVDSGYAVNMLTEKKLIEPCGRLDAPGRPTLYRTTTDFLRVFGLSELGELPTVKVRSDSGESIEITPSDPEEIPADAETPET
jgi:segregation and condensation protein B